VKTKVKSQNAWLSLSVLYCTVLYYSTKRELRDAICFGLYLCNLGTEYEKIFNLKIPVVYAKGCILKIFSQRHYCGKNYSNLTQSDFPASLPSSMVWMPITPLNILESTFLPPINGGHWRKWRKSADNDIGGNYEKGFSTDFLNYTVSRQNRIWFKEMDRAKRARPPTAWDVL
jgi:hypothetical protein